jgi:hypothetical protein
MMMQGVGNIREFTHDAEGTRKASDSAGFAECLSSPDVHVCCVPPGDRLEITETLHIKDGKSVWCPGGGLATLQVKFQGLAIQMSGHSQLHGIKLYPDDVNQGRYDGIGFGQHDEFPFNGTDNAILRDVWIYYPKTGLRLVYGECDWGDIQVAIKWFYDTGIDFRSLWDVGPVVPVLTTQLTSSGKNVIGVESGVSHRGLVLSSSNKNIIGVESDHSQPKPVLVGYSNNNTIRILEEIHGRQEDYDARWISRETYGIRMHGTVNTIIGGEISLAKYAIDDQGTQNRWIGQYVEHCKSIKVGPGAHYFDSHLALESPPIIHPESTVVGQSGLTYSQYCHFERPQASAAELTGLWYFDQNVNGVIVDHSGHGHHLKIVGSPSFVESPYGNALSQDTKQIGGIEPTSLLTACEWTQPFTIVVCFQVKRQDNDDVLISWNGSGVNKTTQKPIHTYTRITSAPGSPHFQDYDGTSGDVGWTSEQFAFARDSEQRTQKWCWLGMYIDPALGKVKLLDSWGSDTESKDHWAPDPPNADPPAFPKRLHIAGGLKSPTSITLFNSSGPGSPGALCFLAFWQRELMLPEFIALINQRTHWQPTPRPTVAMKRLELVGNDGKGHRICYRSSPPDDRSGRKGDIVFNTNPQPSKNVGWICIADDTRGAWKPFGTIGP